MIVMKFGGTSVAIPENILKVKDIITQYDELLVVVV